MYSVYISQFKRNNEVVSAEELMFEIPSMGKFPVQKATVKSSEDSADNFSFTMDMDSPYYDALLQKKTLIRVMYDGDAIFYGRVLSINSSTIYHTKNVTCEGYYAFLNDSYYEGKQDKHKRKITVSDYIDSIIANHNTMTPEKSITRGTIGVTLPVEPDTYEPSGWTQTTSLVNGLTGDFGGHMRVLHASTAPYTASLNWYKYYLHDGGVDRPKVTVGVNILDISSESVVDTIFTRVIPVGATNAGGTAIYLDGYQYDSTHTFSGKAMAVSFIRNLYTDSELTDEFHDASDYTEANTDGTFGKIYRVVNFPDATSQEKLWNETKKWIKECYYGIAPSFTVKAVDMHVVNQDIPKILLGECVDVTYKIVRNGVLVTETKKLVCKSIQYDLFNPENNSYTFGIPTDLLDRNKKTKSKKDAASSIGARQPTPVGGAEDNNLTFEKVYGTILLKMPGDSGYDADYDGTDAARSFKANGERYGLVKAYDPTAPEGEQYFDADLIGVITLPGKTKKSVAVSSDRGIFAFYMASPSGTQANLVSHWYVKHKGYIYQKTGAGLSDFDKIALMIENDTDSTYGGSLKAAQFRSNGKISGSVQCRNPDDSQKTFTAKIVGKFGTAGYIKYVAISQEFGIFAYTHMAYPDTPAYWYQRAQGTSYDNIDGTITTEDQNGNKEIYTTDDGSPDGNKTISMKPTELTGQGSQGEVLVGYDLSSASSSPNWRVKLNVPIQYTDQNGNTQTADGFVSAKDFNIDSIPSFKTKLGVFDVVIAGKVDAIDIEAELAYIRDLKSDQIVADTNVRASNGYFSTAYIADCRVTQHYRYLYENSQGAQRTTYLEKCFNNLLFSESNGVITLTLYPADGSAGVSDSFNMAATQFFIDAVAAAADASNISLCDTITRHTTAPSNSTALNTLSQKLVQAYLNTDGNGRYVRFSANINGGTNTKWYYILM